MALQRFAVLLALFGATLAGCYAAGCALAAQYERVSERRAAAALSSMGLGWARLEADGLRLRLAGEAPDLHAQDLAAETIALAVPEMTLENLSSAPPPRPEALPAMQVELHREGGKIRLIGVFPGKAMRRQITALLGERAPDLWIEDLSGLGAAEPLQRPALALAVEAVLAMPRAKSVLQPGALAITGLTASEETRSAITRRLLAAAPGGLRLEIALHVPPPVIAPFALVVHKRGGGALRLERCAGRTPAEAAQLLGLLRRAGLRDSATGCAHGAGGPPGDWVGAAAAGIGLLGAVEHGRFVLSYREARLELARGLSEAAREDLRQGLRRELPAGFSADVRVDPAPDAPTPRETERAAPILGYWLAIEAAGDSLDLAGTVPSRAEAAALEAFASARFPSRPVRASLTVRTQPAPEAWRDAAAAAMTALAEIEAGRVRLHPGRLELEGTIRAPGDARKVHRMLAEAVPAYAPETALRVDLPAQIAALPLTAGRCARLLNRLMTEQPLAFAPGSAVLEPGALATLDSAAELVARCPRARLEIGGHTDSQGSEGFNQRLSQSRADAVRTALMARGAPLRQFEAKGHGESTPIASNATEAGRAQNRRIAFTALGEGGT